MCGTPKAPPARDIQAEEREAQREATRRANAEVAQNKRRRRRSSLVTNTGGAGGQSSLTQAPGRDRLGA